MRQSNRIEKAIIIQSHVVGCTELHKYEYCMLELALLRKLHTARKTFDRLQTFSTECILMKSYCTILWWRGEDIRLEEVTKTGSRGWQARLTIGFFKSVFIFVGTLPPSTVPTTSRAQHYSRKESAISNYMLTDILVDD